MFRGAREDAEGVKVSESLPARLLTEKAAKRIHKENRRFADQYKGEFYKFIPVPL